MECACFPPPEKRGIAMEKRKKQRQEGNPLLPLPSLELWEEVTMLLPGDGENDAGRPHFVVDW
ncbi:hypothetical protein ACLOJK_005027 [Asimina triloba]